MSIRRSKRCARSTLIAVLSALSACAPTRQTTTFEGAYRVPARTELAGPPQYRAGVQVQGNDVVVHAVWSQDCFAIEREVRIMEHRTDRDVSWWMVIPGGILAAGGVRLLMDPGPPCDGKEYCFYDQAEVNQKLGTLLLAAGAALTIGGLASSKHSVERRPEPGRELKRSVPECVRQPAVRRSVVLALAGGARLAIVTDSEGNARLPIADEVWAKGGGTLRGSLFVQGQAVGDVVLQRQAR